MRRRISFTISDTESVCSNMTAKDGIDDTASAYRHPLGADAYRQVDYHQLKAELAEDIPSAVSELLSPETHTVSANKTFNRATFNKPLPALPHPYFEYLFANADVEKPAAHNTSGPSVDPGFVRLSDAGPLNRDSDGFSIPDIPASSYTGVVRKSNIIGNISSYQDHDDEAPEAVADATSPSTSDPVTFVYNGTPPVKVDMSAFSQYVFHQANVPIMMTDDDDARSIVYMASRVLPRSDYYEWVEAQRQKAIDWFKTLHERAGADKSPNPSHRPAVDIRIGHEEKPQPWINPKEKPDGMTELELAVPDRAMLGIGEYADPPEPVKFYLKPMTYQESEIKRGIKNLTAKWIERRRGKGQAVSIDTGSANSSTSSLKRRAHDSFATRSAKSSSNESVQYLGTKRVRTQSATNSEQPATSVYPCSPVYDPPSSVEEPQSPPFEAQSPIYAPIYEFESPVYERRSPIWEAQSPVDEVKSPVYVPHSSIHVHPSPIDEIKSPVYVPHSHVYVHPSPEPSQPRMFFPGDPIFESPTSIHESLGTINESPSSIIDLTRDTLNNNTITTIIDLVTPTAPAYTPLECELPTPLTDNYKAFPGQFVGVALNMITAKTRLGAMKRPRVTTFGDVLHPNGPIVHKICYPAPVEPIWNYDPETLPRHSTLFRALQDLDVHTELASSAPVKMLRTPSQEDLRREAHLEVATARLEGVSVGQYRYYQGHLSVEEYADNGMCVCWSPCACSRVCSRYGDVMCPCGGDLELERDSDNDR